MDLGDPPPEQSSAVPLPLKPSSALSSSGGVRQPHGRLRTLPRSGTTISLTPTFFLRGCRALFPWELPRVRLFGCRPPLRPLLFPQDRGTYAKTYSNTDIEGTAQGCNVCNACAFLYELDGRSHFTCTHDGFRFPRSTLDGTCPL